MADIRIKDLATTATTTASDDFMAVDGATNGTRKLSAATPAFLTSVTTPSLTSPAATNLTLGLGTGGTALTLASSTLAATFAGAVTATGGLTASSWSLLGAGVWPTTAMGQNGSRVVSSSATENQLFTILNMNTAASGAVGINYGASIYLGARGTDNTADMAIAEIFGARESATSGNLTSYLSFKTSNSIGARTEALRLASTGTVSIASTTAGSAGAGALVVAGGISAGAASYFGGAVTVANANGIDINSGGSTAIFSQSISSVRKNFIYFDGTNTLYGADTGAIILSPSSVVQVASGKALKLGNGYVGTPVVSTGYITIQDNTGTTYKVAVSL